MGRRFRMFPPIPSISARVASTHTERPAEMDAMASRPLRSKRREARLLDHSLYLMRDGLATVSGMDESGHMDAMGLGWVAMMPRGDRPFILQKAGGLQGTFSYIAFAPTCGVAVFIAINQFDFAAAAAMANVANDLIATLAPR